jgi:LemA protein
MMAWILLAIAAAGALWLIGAYNGLVSLKNQVANGWKQIDVQLKRRHDLIPNLVETVKGAMDFEQSTLTKVIEARNKAMSATSLTDKAASESILTGALRQLFALVESYPALKANENAVKLQEELVSTENRIGFARQFYNDIATRYNIAQETFPTNRMAAPFGFSRAQLFEIADEGERQVPKVDLKLTK